MPMFRKANSKILNHRMKTWRQRNPEKAKLVSLKHDMKKHGMTVEDYNQMFVEQQGLCKICGSSQSMFKKLLHIDHCHKTKKVRGLLCPLCNHLLGNAKDEIGILKSAIKYLENSK